MAGPSPLARLLLSQGHAPPPLTPLIWPPLAQAEQPSGWLAGFVARDYPKGYLLASPGDARDQVFVVKSGRLRVYLAGETRELSLSFLEPGDIYTTHTPTYVQTVSPCTLWCIHTADFARRLASDPTITPAMMRVLGRLLQCGDPDRRPGVS